MEDFNYDDVYSEDINFSFIENEYLFKGLSDTEKQKKLIQLGISIQVHYVFIYKDFKKYPYLRQYTEYLRYDAFPKNKFNICERFIYENKVFKLNPKVSEFIYFKLIKEVEENSGYYLEIEINKFDYLLEYIIDENEKIDFYKKKKLVYQAELAFKMEAAGELISSIKNPQKYAYVDLKESVIDHILQYEVELEQYLLTGDLRCFEFTSFWCRVKFIEQAIEYCNKKILEFGEQLPETTNQPIKRASNLLRLFTENGEEIFKFIVGKYDDEKNPAFFCYLYRFLKNKLKVIRTRGVDSAKYRRYILKNFNLDMSRVFKSDVAECYTENDMFELFENLVIEFNKIKNE